MGARTALLDHLRAWWAGPPPMREGRVWVVIGLLIALPSVAAWAGATTDIVKVDEFIDAPRALFGDTLATVVSRLGPPMGGQFDQIQAIFPGSEKAFEAAIYIGSYYKSQGQDEFAKKAFINAERYITKYLQSEISNPSIASRALGYLVKCYLEEGENSNAIEILKSLHNQYRLLPDGKLASLKLADIYENIVYDTTQAVSWLKTYILDNPLDPNIADVEAHIRLLE